MQMSLDAVAGLVWLGMAELREAERFQVELAVVLGEE